MNRISILLLAALATACQATHRVGGPSAAHLDSSGYGLVSHESSSIFSSDSSVASDTEIARALDYEYDVNAIRSVALFPTGTLGRELIGTEQELFERFQAANPELELVRIPRSLMQGHLSAAQLRSIAARLQADTVVLYEFRRHYTYEQHLFSRDEAEFRVTLEYFLFDIRSGIIPHSNAFDHVIETKRSSGKNIHAYLDENFRTISTSLLERMAEDLGALLATGASGS